MPTRTDYQQLTLPSAGPSNSSVIDVEHALNRSPPEAERSRNDVTIEVTFHVTNADNATVVEQASSNDFDDTLSRKRAVNQTTEPNNHSRNNTRWPIDVSGRWIAHLRKNHKARKPLVRVEHDPPLKSPEPQPPLKAGLAALAAGDPYLIWTREENAKRRKSKTRYQLQVPLSHTI